MGLAQQSNMYGIIPWMGCITLKSAQKNQQKHIIPQKTMKDQVRQSKTLKQWRSFHNWIVKNPPV